MLRGFLILSATFLGTFEAVAAESSYTLAEKVEVLESPVAVEWRGVTLYDFLQGIEMISEDGEDIKFYAPVGELASSLDITVVTSSSNEISGWIGDPDNSWYISSDLLLNKDEQFPVEKGAVVSWNGELFASVSTIEKAFGFEIKLNESERVIEIGSNAQIPMLMAFKRSETRKLLSWNEANKKIADQENKLQPFYVEPYAMTSIPTVDGSISFSQSSGDSGSSIGYYASITNQMLYMDSRISLSGNIMTSSDLKPSMSLNSFTLSRNLLDKDGDTLSFSLGDVAFGGVASPTATIGSGRGVSFRKKYAGESDSIENSNFLYEGRGTPGNDIEVYRGENDLIYSSVIPQTGIYEIPKQPLFAGINVFYVREYDAGGLVKEIPIKRSLTRAQVPAGKSAWSFALLQPTANMRDIIVKNSEKESKDNRAGFSLVYSLGITDNFTNTFGYSYLPTKKGDEENYTQVFGNTSTISTGAGSLSLTADTYLIGSTNALTISGSYSMPLDNKTSFSVAHTNYANDAAENLFKKKSSSNASVSFSFPEYNSSSVSYRASWDRNLDDNYQLGLSTFNSTKVGPINLSSAFSATLPSGSTENTSYRASMSASVSPKDVLASGQIVYGKDAKQDWKVNSYGLRVSLLGIKRKWGVTTRFSYDPNC